MRVNTFQELEEVVQLSLCFHSVEMNRNDAGVENSSLLHQLVHLVSAESEKGRYIYRYTSEMSGKCLIQNRLARTSPLDAEEPARLAKGMMFH